MHDLARLSVAAPRGVGPTFGSSGRIGATLAMLERELHRESKPVAEPAVYWRRQTFEDGRHERRGLRIVLEDR